MTQLYSSTMIQILSTSLISAIASTFAVGYSEILFIGTRALYRRKLLSRYFPLPQERHAMTAWMNAFGFVAPTALFASLLQHDLRRSWDFRPLSLLLYTLAYLTIHDIYFYLVHANVHKIRPLYEWFHGMHHEYAYAMNCYIVGYAEIFENFVQVGMPWMAWTYVAGDNWWNWLLPLSLIVFTTLVGHSGYRMSPYVAIFHPMILPFALVAGKQMLTPGDHQMHHSHRRCNFGLFWKTMDVWYGTYRKCEHKAYDVDHWTAWAQKSGENSEEAKKWMTRHAVTFDEVTWGF
ncbi:hypothetical protein AMS68_004176 [Peltaster fructicola]|uniref:Fatty acid hydroxylase domain-containing protein n=1 Tax=Peltaster fructicola TaxID=286661 RepID=A0A6H0XVL5_9PEZI|nr:hypothetical protein AMS68_004176 [Peltaster fructicola]